jgi:hypothetical protein
LEKGINTLGLQLGYSHETVHQFVHERNSNQLECYIRFTGVWDTIFPILYGSMYIAWLALLFRSKVIVFGLPLIRVLSDWIENYLEISMIQQYLHDGTVNRAMTTMSSTCSGFKWLLSIVIYCTLIVGIILLIWKRNKARQ